MSKIAVFTKFHSDLDEHDLLPADAFKIIRKVEDVRGMTFDAVILFHGWSYLDFDGFNRRAVDSRIEAFEVLRQRQPNLFTLKKIK